MTLVEGAPKQRIPFCLGEIPNINGRNCQLFFVDMRKRVLNISDQRVNGFDNISEELTTHMENNTLFLSSSKRKDPTVIGLHSVNPIKIKKDGKWVKGFELGSHVDFWFKEPYIKFEPTGKIKKRSNGQPFKEIKRVYQIPGLGDLKVVAIPQDI